MQFDLHPWPNIDAARNWARDQIDASAGAARGRYITITGGQDATYAAKYAEALAFARAGYPEDQVHLYPWIEAEAEAIGGTPSAAADEIRANGDPWNAVLGPKIESLRIGGKRTLVDLDDIGAVVAHTCQVKAQLAAV